MARAFDSTAAYLAVVKPSLDLDKFPPQFMEYLVVHVAAQVVLQRHPDGEAAYDLFLRKAQDGPFYVASKLVNWNDALLADYLATETAYPRHVPLVKLTGKMRAALATRLEQGKIKRRSLVGSLLAGD